MKTQRIRQLTAGLVAVALLAACGSDDDDAGTESPSTEAATDGTDAATDGTDSMGECDSLEPVSLQLQWFTQAQFAGYFAARDKGFYEDMCLDVTIVEGGVEIVPQTQLANGDVDFALSWVPKALASREAGADIVNIAQIFQRSGTLQVSFVEQDITTPEDFAGKKIGNWGFGNEYEVFAAIGQAGLDPATDVELVGQQFDMVALLDGSIDAAEAMTYNEYAQVLEAVNPDTGELYQPRTSTSSATRRSASACCRTPSGPMRLDWRATRSTGTPRSASSPARCRGGRTAATTSRSAATSWSLPAPHSVPAISCGR
jgi:NitT/TauT family transport system substrate-binding protein